MGGYGISATTDGYCIQLASDTVTIHMYSDIPRAHVDACAVSTHGWCGTLLSIRDIVITSRDVCTYWW